MPVSTLLWLSSRQRSVLGRARAVCRHRSVGALAAWALHLSEEGPGDVSLETATDFPLALAFGCAAVSVSLCGGVVAEAAHGDGVQGPVELSVTVAVEAMSYDTAGGRFEGCDATQRGERGLAATASSMRERDKELRRAGVCNGNGCFYVGQPAWLARMCG